MYILVVQFITSVVYSTRYKIFIASSLDLSFKLYNSDFLHIFTITHNERAILNIQYDEHRNRLISAGGTGVIIWKISRKCVHRQRREYTYNIEQDFVFTELSHQWVSIMKYESSTGYIYG